MFLSSQIIPEDDYVISTGSKKLSLVRIASGSIVSPNTVAIFDVPPKSITVGIPAKIMPRVKSHQSL